MLRERLIARSGPRHHEFQWLSREVSVVIGVNGLITGFRSETGVENVLTMGFAAAEVVAPVYLIRFRATRKNRRARFLESLTAPLSTEQLPLHAN
jgi:hypothetical protein